MTAETLTKKELKDILNTVLREIDRDPGRRSAARRRGAAPDRVPDDLKLVVNVSRDDSGRLPELELLAAKPDPPEAAAQHGVDGCEPRLSGAGNPAIAIARGSRTNIEDPGAALRSSPAAKPLFSRYRQLSRREVPPPHRRVGAG